MIEAGAATAGFCWGICFFRKEQRGKRLIVSCILAVICAILMLLFNCYQYHPVKSFRYLVLVLFMVSLGATDARERRLPNSILAAMFFVRTAFLAVECILAREYWIELALSALIGLAVIGIFFLIVWVISRKGLGAGDVKAMAILGYWLGFSVASGVIFIALVLMVIVGLIQVARKKISVKDSLPMGPFLTIAVIFVLAVGMY